MTFFNRSEDVPIRTQQVPQTIETPVTFVSAPGAYVRYAYSRSSDSMASQIEGQDYLCFRHNDQRMVFVVCDGVGSSFCGNLAARLVGDSMLDWLWSLDVTYLGGASALQEAAVSHLNRFQKQAQYEVAEYEISEEISGLVRQALEAQRAYGSEAIFAAARIDHPSITIPDGLISVCWMGDTQIHVHDEEGEAIDIGGVWDNANRWSTVQGVKGRMNAWMHSLELVGRVYAFTDGLNAHADQLFEYGDAKLDREIHVGARLPTSDDVAFVDVVLRSPLYEGYADPALPDINVERPFLEQIWNPTGGGSFEMRWNWPGSDKDRFLIQQASNPALSDMRLIEVPNTGTSWKPDTTQPPGHYYYRVRAVKRHGAVSPWSELRQTRVAYPPPPPPTLRMEEGYSPTLHWSEEDELLDYVLEQARMPDFSDSEVVYSGRGTSWTIPTGNRKPGMVYYRVQASSDGGASAWSETQEYEIRVPPPPTPQLGAGRYGHAQGPLEFRWQPVPGAVRYELQRRDLASDEKEIMTLEDTTYVMAELGVGEHVFTLRACNEYTCSEWSNEQRITISPDAPDEAPTLAVGAPDSDGNIELTWSEVPTASEYVIELSDDEDFRNARVHTETKPAMKLQRREPGIVYVRVSGANSGGDGPWSSVEKLVILADAPAWIEQKLIEETGLVHVTWGSAGAGLTYLVELIVDEDVSAAKEVFRGGATSHEMPVPGEASEMRFRVKALHGGAESAWVAGQLISVGAAPPPPTLEAPTIDERSTVRLHWNAIPGVAHYILEAARTEDFQDPHSSTPINDTEILFHAPTSGKYWFRVKSATKTRAGSPGKPVSITAARPSPPLLWPVDPVKASQPFEVAWKGTPGCVFYEIQDSTTADFLTVNTHSTRVFHPAQKIAMEGRPAGRVYFRVRTADDQNEFSVWSDNLVVEVN